jgi:LPXTG-site transpeptidase (sortase) family protein
MRTLLGLIEGVLWITGLALVGLFVGELGVQELQRINAVAAFHSTRHLSPESVAVPAIAVLPGDEVSQGPAASGSAGQVGLIDYEPPPPDQSLWSAGRIVDFAASLAEPSSPVIGVFSIPRFDLELPVYNGATELHMNRGIARIDGTSMPGEGGNLGIAGHRDGYFRVLKDIGFGDEIVVTGPDGPSTYLVEQLMVVDPSAVEVLHQTDRPAITLVTCYPFYYVGHAPERFIVRAVLKE